MHSCQHRRCTDVSGINLLCSAPVAAHLWAGKLSADEMVGVKDQSISMLAIASSIFIWTIIQATLAEDSRLLSSKLPSFST